MLSPLQEEYFFEAFPLPGVDIKVPKYFICPKNEFGSICPNSTSPHFPYQFNKSVFVECLQCPRNHGWYVAGHTSF